MILSQVKEVTSDYWSGLYPQLIGAGIIVLGYIIQFAIFRQQIKKDKEREFKSNSLTLSISLQNEFLQLSEIRSTIGNRISYLDIINRGEIRDRDFEYLIDMEEIIDFFDSLGFYVKEEYINIGLVHENFYHWLSHYHQFYATYQYRSFRNYPSNVWKNFEWLNTKLLEIEAKERNLESIPRYSEIEMLSFFEDEEKSNEESKTFLHYRFPTRGNNKEEENYI